MTIVAAPGTKANTATNMSLSSSIATAIGMINPVATSTQVNEESHALTVPFNYIYRIQEQSVEPPSQLGSVSSPDCNMLD